MNEFFQPINSEDKAGYNQAGEITKILATLRGSFISAMMHNEFSDALESCRGVLNVISGKVSKEVVDDMNEVIYTVEGELPAANEIYTTDAGKYWKNSKNRIAVKRMLESLWRNLESIQDEYGYGMFSEDDSGL